MKYKERIEEAIFIERPNRFIAIVEHQGKPLTVHVKNTGRCKELLQKGCKAYLAMSDSPERKTPADLIAVEKISDNGQRLLINMDSQIPNAVAEEWLRGAGIFSDKATYRREVTYGNSRFDISVTDGARKAFVEVKGVTLEDNGTVMFPDAPTERGVKHLGELIDCINEGYEAYIIFVIQMKEATLFKPNERTHPEFASKLREAHKAGVNIIAINCEITPDSISAVGKIELML